MELDYRLIADLLHELVIVLVGLGVINLPFKRIDKVALSWGRDVLDGIVVLNFGILDLIDRRVGSMSLLLHL